MKANNVTKIMTVAFTTVLVSACAYQPGKYQAGVSVPASFSGSESISILDEPQRHWWSKFQTEELVEFMDEMNANNNDITIARHRIDQSLALMGVQKSSNWPQLTGNLSTEHDKNYETDEASDYDTLTFTASYEVGLWGMRDANNKTSEYRLRFQQEELKSISLSLQAIFSLQYFNSLALKERVELTRKNLDATEQLYQRIKIKYELGQSSRIELDQQNNILLDQEKKLKILERDFHIARRGISVLLGRDSFEDIKLSANINDIQLPNVAIVQPARLLETRPDVSMAELNLRISDAELFSAKAKRWPNLTLSLGAGLNDALDNGDVTTSLLGSLTAPIFQGGRIRSQITSSEVNINIQLETYRKTVINAIQETLDTLTAYEFQQTIYDLQHASVANNERLYEQAKLQYELGATDFLNLLAAQRSLFTARDELVQEKVIYLENIINAFKAMGVSPSLTQEAIFMSRANASQSNN